MISQRVLCQYALNPSSILRMYYNIFLLSECDKYRMIFFSNISVFVFDLDEPVTSPELTPISAHTSLKQIVDSLVQHVISDPSLSVSI